MDPNQMDDNTANHDAVTHPLQATGLWNMGVSPNFWFRPSSMQSHQQQYPHGLAYWQSSHPLPNQMYTYQEPLRGQTVSASPVVPEQKKHKRTRSGCFTCRARRVKCDEKRPTCNRCSKGKRECRYPPPTARSGSKLNLKAGETCPIIAESESEADEKAQDAAPISSIEHSLDGKSPGHSPTEATGGVATDQSSHISHKNVASSPDAMGNTCTSPVSDMTAPLIGSHSPIGPTDISRDPSASSPDSVSSVSEISHLSDEVQFFLRYYTQNITYSHYMMKSFAEKFVKEDMIKCALEYEPLLYAVVAFTAYHYSIQHPKGKLYTFFRYYDKSVSSLLHSLKSKQPHKDATILTILQLTTFEEYVGDWVNLIDHHQAAHRMILELYTPETILEDEFHTHILYWHMRYDVMAGLMSGNAVILGREWYVEAEKRACQISAEDKGSVAKSVYVLCARNKRCSMDFASLLAKVSQDFISQEDFLAEGRVITEIVEDMLYRLSLLDDPNCLIMDFPNKKPLDIDDIVDPYVPGLVHSGPLCEVDLVRLEIRSSLLMYKCQIDLITGTLDPSELTKFALEQCQLVETINRLPDKSPIFPLMFNNVVGLLCLYLPRDDRHKMWCRRRLAEIEQHGYIYPPAFRKKVADLWKLPEIDEWWLPNGEGYPNLVREIREWTLERSINPRDNFREAVRDIRSIFGRMTCSDTSSHEGSPGAADGAYDSLSPETSSLSTKLEND